MPEVQTPCLIAGAGPTGLVLALALKRQGVPFRIIDKNSGPGQASRALVVQARTLEFYRQMGIAEAVIARGIVIEHAQLRRKGAPFAKISFKDFGKGLSPYAFALGYPQDDHERFLIEQLEAAGVEVEWNTELKSFSQDDTVVRVVLDKAGTEETVRSSYLCGCDGARSAVRQGLQLDFPGGTYSHLFYVADVKAEGEINNDLLINLAADSFALMLPVRSSGMQRLIGIVPDDLMGRSDLTYEDIRAKVEPVLQVHVTQVNWFSTYHVHHRVASRFKVGRCFLSGDAGHIHSPAGGQGMNTGIGDAVNLAWKLANVLSGRAPDTLLDSYDTERIGFARMLVASTDSAFKLIVSKSAASVFLRSWIVPHILPTLSEFPAVRREFYRAVSQIRISYRDSALSQGKAGSIAGGDRLPWVDGQAGDNFAPLRSMDWQMHVYGAPSDAVRQASAGFNLPCHVFAWSEAARRAGLAEGAAYLVRPDGHVGLAIDDQDAGRLRAYVERMGLRF